MIDPHWRLSAFGCVMAVVFSIYFGVLAWVKGLPVPWDMIAICLTGAAVMGVLAVRQYRWMVRENAGRNN